MKRHRWNLAHTRWLLAIAPVACGGATLPGPAQQDAALDVAALDSAAHSDGATHDATADAVHPDAGHDATLDAVHPDAAVDAHRPPRDATTADVSTCTAPLGLCPAPDGGAPVCVDLAANAQSCGACGVACAAGEVCNAGACAQACTVGLLVCAGACIDPATSVAYCGATGDCAAGNVGVACDPTSVCVGGVCKPLCDGGLCGTCPTNLTACGAGCTDVESDAVNCGACGHDCLGGGCEDGMCQPVLLAAGGGGPIAIDAVNVYFQGSGSGDVVLMKVPKGGGTPVAITTVPMDGGTEPTLPSPRVSIHALAVSTTDAYFLTTATMFQTGPTLEGILTAPLNGGPRTTFLPESEIGDEGPTAGPLPDTGALAVDGLALYWNGLTGVGSTPLAGGPVTYLVGGPPLDAGFVGGGGNSLIVNSTLVIWGTSFGIFSVPKAGGTVSTLVAPPAMPRLLDPSVGDVAADGVNVYWVGPGLILAEPLTGGVVSTLASGRTSPGAIATDGQVVVWSDSDGIFRVPVGGGPPTPVSSQGASSPLAMDATRIYFIADAGVASVAR